MSEDQFPGWHGTTIIGVKKGGEVVIAGDGQVSLGQTVIKGTARKVRRLSPVAMTLSLALQAPLQTPSRFWNAWKPNLKPHPANWPAPL